MSDWRADPGWQLVSFDSETYKQPPPEKPPPEAELANDPAFASVYRDHRVVATWMRTLPLDEATKRRLAEAAKRGEARRARRESVD